MKIKKNWKNYRKEGLFLFLCLSLLAFLIFSNLHILKFKEKIITPNKNNLKNITTVTIFAGGMKNKTEMSNDQKERVIKGVETYKKFDDVKQILITGDDGGRRVNEVSSMKNLALKMGVPSNDIIIDPNGYGTYESCYRAQKTFGIEKMVAVSQSFHLPRIIYICSDFGVKTLGVPASKQENYLNNREVLARAKAIWQTEITQPQPDNMWEVKFGF
ncbi:MAG: hypothetical protein BRC22_00555 [Parcubacteria group bacterium QH_9_35_7]|nr:MAG: hypothetical protein BRC22_00555 [Parcubacteria group bacterium QH_9_35_7]